MTKSAVVTASFLSLVVGCVAGAGIRNVIVPARAAGAPSAVFEYRTVDLQATFGISAGDAAKNDELLNRFGREGWRLAGSLGRFHYFERQSAPDRAP